MAVLNRSRRLVNAHNMSSKTTSADVAGTESSTSSLSSSLDDISVLDDWHLIWSVTSSPRGGAGMLGGSAPGAGAAVAKSTLCDTSGTRFSRMAPVPDMLAVLRSSGRSLALLERVAK